MRLRRARRSAPAAVDDLADLADLLRVALGSGYTVARAVALVGDHLHTAVTGAFVASIERADLAPYDAIAALPDDLGEASRELCAALVAAGRYGAPVVPALERVAFELRLTRRLEVEARARRVSVLLLLPLVSCVLPAFVLLAIVPLALGVLSALPGAAP